MHSPEFLTIHIMKTAGTSLRGMLIDGLGADAVYPNEAELAGRRNGWYPRPAQLVKQVRSGAAGSPRLVMGHVPYVFVDEFEHRPMTIALLRQPVARALSMLEHRRTRPGPLHRATHTDLLRDEGFLGRQVRDYQTKMFAFDSVSECPDGVDQDMTIDDARFERALGRLREVDVLGVVEQMPAFVRRLTAATGITTGEERHANRGGLRRYSLPVELRQRLEALTERDAVLYHEATKIVAERDARGRGLSQVLRHLAGPMQSWRGGSRNGRP